VTTANRTREGGGYKDTIWSSAAMEQGGKCKKSVWNAATTKGNERRTKMNKSVIVQKPGK
jgi:hypothetical protein